MYHFNRNQKIGWGVRFTVAALAAVGSGVASTRAQPTENNRIAYRLTEKSSFQHGCFDPCMCPISEQGPVIGTFVLEAAGSSGGFASYVVEDVNWEVPYYEPRMRVTGSGKYTIGSPDPITVLQHRLELDLKLGADPVQHFDSGWVIGPNLPHFDITISMNNMYCLDKVFILDADPVPESEIHRYALTPESTLARGCVGFCDCVAPNPQPLSGTFSLVPIGKNPLFSDYAMIDVQWFVHDANGSSVPPNLLVSGVGAYMVGGEVAVQQRMRADLQIGDLDSVSLDSGLVVGGFGFPDRIDVVMSRPNEDCYDTIVHIVAADLNAAVVCGGIAGIPCPEGQFCKYSIGECCCDFQGVCMPIPEACITLWDPVCGCDGKTYGNECEADRVGVAIDYRGECLSPCDPTTGNGCVKVIIDMNPDVPGFQSSITVPPGDRMVRKIGVYIFDPNGSNSIYGIGYLGGLDRGIAFGYSPTNTHPQGRVDALIAHVGAPVNRGNTPMVLQPPMDKGFSGPEVQYLEFGAAQPALIAQVPVKPIFTVDVVLHNACVGDRFTFQLMDFVRVWSGGSAGAFSTQSPMSLDTGGDVVLDGTLGIYGLDADAAIPVPPAAFYVDFVDRGPQQIGAIQEGATIDVAVGNEPIPAASTWGIVVMIGLLLSAGSIVIKRSRSLDSRAT